MRFAPGGNSDGRDTYTFKLSEDDLPVLARLFQLGWSMVGRKICWSCRACGEMGSILECNPEKHKVFYDDLESNQDFNPDEFHPPLSEKDKERRYALTHPKRH